VRRGKALYVGISSYKPEEASRAAKILRGLGTPCLIHQPLYNILNRWIESGLLNVLAEEGIGCIAYCPLAQGLLTGRYIEGIPAGSRASKPHSFLKPQQLTPERLAAVKALNDIAAARGQSLAQMALAWVLRHPGLTSALIGASRVEQLEENVAALRNLAFTPDELARIDAVAAAVPKPA
jgi:L-glyceraldehyde 3-phosphate reductase